jgi:hypothetical protein
MRWSLMTMANRLVEEQAHSLEFRNHWDHRLVGLESVILGERNLGQEALEIVISGYATPGEAEGGFRRQMEDLIRA